MNHSQPFPEHTGRIKKMKKAWKDLENRANPTPAMGFSAEFTASWV